MGKGGGGTNTVTSNAAPPPEVMAQYQNVINQANQASGQPLQQYGGDIVAPFNDMQNQAFQGVQNAQGLAQPYFNQAQGLIQNSSQPISPIEITPELINKYTNPYTQNVINSTMANINQQNQGEQQSLIGNAAQQGAWGGDRSAVAQALLSHQQQLANNQTIAGLESQGYSQALGEANTQQQQDLAAKQASQYLGQQGGFGLMNLGMNAQNSALTGANALTAAGGLQQQLAQERLNVPYEQFQQAQAYPYQNIGWLSQISTGLGSGMGGASSTTSPAPGLGQQLGGLGLTGLGIYGASGGFSGATSGMARGGLVKGHDHAGLIKRLAEGGAVLMPAHYDMGGIIPGQVTSNEMESNRIPDVSRGYIPGAPSLTHGPGVSMMKSSGTNSKTTGLPDNSGASISNDVMAARGLRRLVGGSGPGESLASRAGTSFDVANAQANGLGDMVQGFQTPSGATNLAGATNAAGDSIQSGVTSDAAGGFWDSVANTLGLDSSATSTAALAAPDVAMALPASDIAAAAATDAAAAVGTDLAATAATDAALTTAAAETMPEWITALMAFFNQGGAVQTKKSGGLIKGYDDGGSISADPTPFDTTANPMTNSANSKFSQLPVEKLEQLSDRAPETTPQGQMIRKILMQKQMMPNVGQNPAVPNMPMASLPTNQFKKGGLIKGYDNGGDVDDLTTLFPDVVPATNSMQSRVSMPVNLTGGSEGGDDLPAAGLVKTEPASYVASQQSGYTPTAPINKPDPWLALASAGAGMMASKSPHALTALGEGATEGLKSYSEQKKQAAQESYQQGNLQKAAESLAEEANYHKGTLANQEKELGIKQKEADLKARQKWVIDPNTGMPMNVYTGELKNPYKGTEVALPGDAAAAGKPVSDIPDDYFGALHPSEIMNYRNVVKKNQPKDLQAQQALVTSLVDQNQKINDLVGQIPVASHGDLHTLQDFVDRNEIPVFSDPERAKATVAASYDTLGNVLDNIKTTFGGTGRVLQAEFATLKNELNAAANMAPEQKAAVVGRIQKHLGEITKDQLQYTNDVASGMAYMPSRVYKSPMQKRLEGMVTNGGAAPKTAGPGESDISYLKQNPSMAPRFDAQFGAGASQQYLTEPAVDSRGYD